jgi:hypothetical protein
MMNRGGFGRMQSRYNRDHLISSHLSRGTEENHGIPQTRVVCIPAEIRNKYLPNASLDRYRHASLLGFVACFPETTLPFLLLLSLLISLFHMLGPL